MTPLVIAIDGPAASGKSSVSRGLAERLGFGYINSGAMYRAITWYVLLKGANPDDASQVELVVQNAQVETGFESGHSFIMIDRMRPIEELRGESINRYVSAISTVPAVRDLLVHEFRKLATQGGRVVVEGRDIGSVVFPDTPFKFYLDAPQNVRQLRRSAQGQQDEIATRDRIDSSRHTAPLVIARDARVIDTGALDLEEVINAIFSQIQELRGAASAP